MEQREIALNGTMVSYTLIRKSVKNINLRIQPQKGLSVSAPLHTPLIRIEQVLRQHAQRILYALQELALEQPERQQYPITYTTGETVLYLGTFHTLQVARATQNGVQKQGSILRLLVCRPEDPAVRQKTFDNWWKRTCERMVRNMCRAVYPIFAPHQVEFPEIRFRQMVSMWGNCRPQRKIVTFNYRLLAAEPACVEYVVLHEFAHFLHPNHGKQFCDFLEKELPDWRQLQYRLQKTVDISLAVP